MSQGETLVVDPSQVDLFTGTQHGPLDKAAMLRDEYRRIENFYRNSNPHFPLPMTTERWVEHIFEKHQDLIQCWRGWRYHGDWISTPYVDENMLIEIFDRMKGTVYNCLQHEAIPRLLNEIEGGQFVAGEHSPWGGYANLTDDEQRRYDEDREIRRQLNLLEPGISFRLLRGKYFEPRAGDKEEDEFTVFFTTEDAALVKLKKGVAVARPVLRTVRSYIKKHPKLNDKEKQTIIGAWERMFEEIGHLWSGNLKQYSVSFTCAPSSFLRLGHFGESSCYCSGGGYELSKFVLAETRNSLVSLIYRLDDSEGPSTEGEAEGREWWQPRQAKVKGRAWGVGVPEYGLSLSNFYLIDREVHGSIAAETARRALKVKQPLNFTVASSEVNSMGQEELIYVNGDARDYSIEGGHYDHHRRKLQEISRDCDRVCSNYYDHRDRYADGDDYYDGPEDYDHEPF